MRTIEIDGRPWEIRGLKRKQVKQLKRDGHDLTNLQAERADDAVDAVFAMAFGPEELEVIEEMYNADVMRLWSAILKETYGAPGEEKNS